MGKSARKKSVVRSILIIFCLLISACENAKDLPLLTRYMAKNVCAAYWIEGYQLDSAMSYVSNVAPLITPSWGFDIGLNSVTAKNHWFPWVSPKSADLIYSDDNAECRNHYPEVVSPASTLPSIPNQTLPFVDAVDAESALQKYLDAVIAVGAPEYSTAILVVQGNRVLAEAYSGGVNGHSPLKGFSMSKSFANLLVGRQVAAGAFGVYDAMNIPAWRQDERAMISWHDSLRMSSGLTWNEAALGQQNDQGQMFYNSANPSQYALEKALAEPAGSLFNYSSGDYMNVSTALVNSGQNWFNPGWNVGQYALEFSPDGQYPLLAEGVMLTTRGWAALAAIYMNDGRLGDQQILPADWVHYSLTPSATNYDYGAGIWLNWGQSFFPELPMDTFIFAGSYDRYVVAIPSENLIFVRIGFSSQPGDFDMQRFVLNARELVDY